MAYNPTKQLATIRALEAHEAACRLLDFDHAKGLPVYLKTHELITEMLKPYYMEEEIPAVAESVPLLREG